MSLLRTLLRRWHRPRGRILAVKWGYNPNSSSLGVDVTFLLFGLAAIVLLTPIVSMILRARRVLGAPAAESPEAPLSVEKS